MNDSGLRENASMSASEPPTNNARFDTGPDLGTQDKVNAQLERAGLRLYNCLATIVVMGVATWMIGGILMLLGRAYL